MASVNKVFVLGALGRDPETRTSGKTAITNLSLATSRKYKTADGDIAEETEWHRIALFGRVAEIAAQYLHKGDSVHIEGRLRTRKYTDKDGIERYATEIVGEHMTLLPNGKRQGGNSGAGSDDGYYSSSAGGGRSSRLTADSLSEEDIPF